MSRLFRLGWLLSLFRWVVLMRWASLFRWSYLAPRLIVVLGLVCLSEYSAGWITKLAIQAFGQPALGAKIDIKQSEASILGGRLAMRGVAVADPNDPMRNLFEADAILLDVDTGALLHKRGEITRGVVRGLRIGGNRVSSGEYKAAAKPPAAEGAAPAWIADTAKQGAEQWLDGVGDRLSTDITGELQSPALVAQLRKEWPERYRSLEADAQAIRREYQSLESEAKQASQNPLRHAGFLRELPTRVADLDRRIGELSDKARALPGALAADRQRVAAARRHDQESLREKLTVSNVDGEQLTQYLVGDRFAEPVQQVIGWLRFARAMAPAKVDRPSETVASRGVDILPAGVRRRPDLLLRTLELTGETRLGGRPVQIAGMLTNLTSQPGLHGEPIRLEMTADGAAPMRLLATVDRTKDRPRDEILLVCDNFVAPEVKLGSGERLGLTVAACPSRFTLSLLIEDEQLTGDAQLVQRDFSATPIIKAGSPKLTGPLQSALAANLRRLPTIATRVDLSGTFDKPEVKLWSNLGPAVASALETSAKHALSVHTDQLLAQATERVDAELAGLEQEAADASAKLGPLLAGVDQELKQVASKLTGGNPFKHLGRMPVGGLFK